MLTLSDMVYVFTALRRHARKTRDAALQERLAVPQISSTLVPQIVDNVHLLGKGRCHDDDFCARAIQTVNRNELTAGSTETSEVIYIGDSEDDRRNSCVYGIAANRSAQRITVWFRGTAMDEGGMHHWRKNFDTSLRMEENPLDDGRGTDPIFYLHRGFVQALLGRRRKILRQVREYRARHPETRDYPLFVSGHSLGGALATLFGFHACQEPDVARCGPVRVYTFAAPPVGDGAFARVFRRLEDAGRIRLARIHNAGDPVPSAFALTRYTHAGLGIELDFPGYGVAEGERSSLGKVKTILRGPREHRLSQSYAYLNRHARGFRSTLDEMYARRARGAG